MSLLKNKIAVVTGGSSGIGLATAKRDVHWAPLRFTTRNHPAAFIGHQLIYWDQPALEPHWQSVLQPDLQSLAPLPYRQSLNTAT